MAKSLSKKRKGNRSRRMHGGTIIQKVTDGAYIRAKDGSEYTTEDGTVLKQQIDDYYNNKDYDEDKPYYDTRYKKGYTKSEFQDVANKAKQKIQEKQKKRQQEQEQKAKDDALLRGAQAEKNAETNKQLLKHPGEKEEEEAPAVSPPPPPPPPGTGTAPKTGTAPGTGTGTGTAPKTGTAPGAGTGTAPGTETEVKEEKEERKEEEKEGKEGKEEEEEEEEEEEDEEEKLPQQQSEEEEARLLPDQAKTDPMISQLANSTHDVILSTAASNIAANREEECDKIIDKQNQQIFNEHFKGDELKFKFTLKKTVDGTWGFELNSPDEKETIDKYLLKNIKTNGGRSKKVVKRNRKSRSKKSNGR